MKIPIYQIDAFASRVFAGNPAAVCPLERWLPDETLQSIATENNLSETAFFVEEKTGYHIRWLTPVAEVDLCGHATLASAYVLFNELNAPPGSIEFTSRSGPLIVEQHEGLLSLDFPNQKPGSCKVPEELLNGMGGNPLEALCSEDYFVVYAEESDIHHLHPNMDLLKKLGLRGVIATARGKDVDFVSRFFVPGLGIDEDPVTGSAHCALAPYWAEKLGKDSLHALQVSKRGGELFCQVKGDRVIISGKAAKYMEGTLNI